MNISEARDARLTSEQGRRAVQSGLEGEVASPASTPSTVFGFGRRDPASWAGIDDPSKFRVPESISEQSFGDRDMGIDLLVESAKHAYQHPERANAMFDALKRKGYDTGIYEPIMEVIAGGMRTVEGVAQGFMWNILPTTFDPDLPSNKTAGFFGYDFDPWLEGGRLLGSMISGQMAYATGAKYLSKPIARGLQRFIPEGNKIPFLGNPKHVRKAGLFVGRNLPEGIVGGVAQSIREEDIDALLPAFLQWTAIGIVGDAATRKIVNNLQRMWRKKKNGTPLDAADREDLKEVQDIAESIERPGDYLGEVPSAPEPHQGRFSVAPNGNLIRHVGDKPQEVPAVVLSQKDADRWVASHLPSGNTTRVIDGEIPDLELLLPKERLEATRISQVRGRHYNMENVLPEGFAENLGPIFGGHGSRLARNSFLNLEDIPIKFTDDIPESHVKDVSERFISDQSKKDLPRDTQKLSMSAKYNPEDNIIYANRGMIKQDFANRVWMKPDIEGVDSLAEDAFKTYPEWEEFAIRKARLRATMEQAEGETVGALENRINTKAMAELDEAVAQAPRPLAPVLPENERFYTYMSGDDPGREKARTMYRETMGAYLSQVEIGDVSPAGAAQVINMQVRRMAGDPSMFPQSEITQVIAGEADKMHLSLFEAVANKSLTAEEATSIIHSAMRTGESPIAIDQALRGLLKDSEITVEAASIVEETPDIIKNHPLFNQTPENWRKPLPGGEEKASPEQLNRIQLLLAQLSKSKWELDIDNQLPSNLSEGDAARIIDNLSDGQAKLRVDKNDETWDLINESRQDKSDDVLNTGIGETPFDGVPSRELADAANDPASVTQAGWLFRWTGYGVVGNELTGLSKNPISRVVVKVAQHQEQLSQMFKAKSRTKVGEIVKILDPDSDLNGIWRTPARLFRETRRVIGESPTGEEILTERLHLLGQALDGEHFDERMYLEPGSEVFIKLQNEGLKAIRSDPKLKQAYEMARELTDEIADHLGLDRGRRISNYLSHIFMGRSGKLRAALLENKMRMTPAIQKDFNDLVIGPRHIPGRSGEGAEDIFQAGGITGEGPELIQKLFGHLKHRSKNVRGYEFNFYTVMNAYIEGAGDYVAINRTLKEGKDALAMMPEGAYIRKKGTVAEEWRKTAISQNIKTQTADYLYHVAGGASKYRKTLATWFTDSPRFNQSVDQIIGYVGAGKEGADIMRIIREGTPDELRLHRAGADAFLNELSDASRTADRVSGQLNVGAGIRGSIKEPGKAWRKQRARTALKINNLKLALQDEDLQAPVLSQIYRTQMIAKLGLNLGFGLINMTQLVSHGWPLLGTKYAARGTYNFLRRNEMIHGKTARELLGEMGVFERTARVEEAIELVGNEGFLKKAQEIAMKPGKWSEEFNRGAVGLGEYERLMDGGAAHGVALHKAMVASDEANFIYNRTGTAPILRNPGLKLALMFQSYTINTIGFTSKLGREAYGSAMEKGLITAAVDGDLDPLMRHMTFYLLALGATVPPILKETLEYFDVPDLNIQDRVEHPLMAAGKDAFTDRQGRMSANEIKRRGPIGLAGNLLGGPYFDTLTDLMTGQVEDAIFSFAVPSTLSRLGKQGIPTSTPELVKVLGLKKYTPPGKKVKFSN